MRLQDFLRDDDFARAVAAGLRGERNADRVADAFLQQNGKRRRRGDDALRAHARFGEAQMQCIVAARRQHAIDGDQVLDFRTLGRDHDPVAAKPSSSARAADSNARLDDRFMHHVARILRRRRGGVLIHQIGSSKRLVERAPIDADAHRPVVLDRDLNHLREIAVLLLLEADVAGIDAVFRQRLGAGRMVGKQRVAVVVEVADRAASRRPSGPAGRGYGERPRPIPRGRR